MCATASVQAGRHCWSFAVILIKCNLTCCEYTAYVHVSYRVCQGTHLLTLLTTIKQRRRMCRLLTPGREEPAWRRLQIAGGEGRYDFLSPLSAGTHPFGYTLLPDAHYDVMNTDGENHLHRPRYIHCDNINCVSYSFTSIETTMKGTTMHCVFYQVWPLENHSWFGFKLNLYKRPRRLSVIRSHPRRVEWRATGFSCRYLQTFHLSSVLWFSLVLHSLDDLYKINDDSDKATKFKRRVRYTSW